MVYGYRQRKDFFPIQFLNCRIKNTGPLPTAIFRSVVCSCLLDSFMVLVSQADYVSKNSTHSSRGYWWEWYERHCGSAAHPWV